MTTDFVLDSRLAADTVVVGEFPLCRLLLMNDAHYPWCILVPRREGIREVYELDTAARAMLMEESCQLGTTMMHHFGGDKLNVAALGNMVPQLHLHHIVRYRNDPAWPGPVWGIQAPRPYLPADLTRECATLAALLAPHGLQS